MQSRIRLAGFSFVVASLAFCGTAAIIAEVPTMPVVEKAFEPTDCAGLKPKSNRRVVVEGRIVGALQIRVLDFEQIKLLP